MLKIAKEMGDRVGVTELMAPESPYVRKMVGGRLHFKSAFLLLRGYKKSVIAQSICLSLFSGILEKLHRTPDQNEKLLF